MAIGAGTAVRGVLGAAQLIGGLLSNPGPRPVMKTPAQVGEITSRARNRANATTDVIAQNQNQTIDNNLNTGVANVKRSAKSPADIIGALTRLYGNANQAKMGVSNNFAARREAREGRLNSALMTEAKYEDRNFNYNQVQPFEEAVSARNNLIGAGIGNIGDATDMQNMMNAISNNTGYGPTASAQSTGAQGFDIKKMMQQLQKKNNFY